MQLATYDPIFLGRSIMSEELVVADKMLLSLFKHESTDSYKRTVTYICFKTIEAGRGQPSSLTRKVVIQRLTQRYGFSEDDISSAIAALYSVFDAITVWTNVKIKQDPPVHLNARTTLPKTFSDWIEKFSLNNPQWVAP